MPVGELFSQVMQPMHTSLSLLTMPVSSFLVMAPVGQFATQAGSSQRPHVIEA